MDYYEVQVKGFKYFTYDKSTILFGNRLCQLKSKLRYGNYNEQALLTKIQDVKI